MKEGDRSSLLSADTEPESLAKSEDEDFKRKQVLSICLDISMCLQLWGVVSQASSLQKSLTILSMLEKAFLKAQMNGQKWTKHQTECIPKVIWASVLYRPSELKCIVANIQPGGRRNKTPMDLRASFPMRFFSFGKHISNNSSLITDEAKAYNKTRACYLIQISTKSPLRMWTEALPAPKLCKKSITEQAV